MAIRLFRSYGYHQDIGMNKSKYPPEDDWFRKKVGLATLREVASSQRKIMKLARGGTEKTDQEIDSEITTIWFSQFILPKDFRAILDDSKSL